MDFTIYSNEGRYKMALTCPTEKDRDLNMDPGDYFVPGQWPEDTYLDGDLKVMPIPPAPAKNMTFDVPSRQWVDRRGADKKAADLAQEKQLRLREITLLREKARLPYITDIAGQDALYMTKLEESRWLMQDEAQGIIDHRPEDYPSLYPEVGTTADSLYEVAQVVLNKNWYWRPLCGEIDRACFQASDAVEHASSEKEIAEIVENLKTSLQQQAT